MITAYRYFFTLKKHQILEDDPEADIEEIFYNLDKEWHQMEEKQKLVYVNLSKGRTVTSTAQSDSEVVDVDFSDETTSSQSSDDRELETIDEQEKPTKEDDDTQTDDVFASRENTTESKVNADTTSKGSHSQKKVSSVKKDVKKKTSQHHALTRKVSVDRKTVAIKSTKDKKSEKEVKNSIAVEESVELSGRTCKRSDCGQPAIKNHEMEDNFCSSECCIQFCKTAFQSFTDALKREAQTREVSAEVTT